MGSSSSPGSRDIFEKIAPRLTRHIIGTRHLGKMAGGNQKKKEAIARKEIEQLKREAGVKRKPMTVTTKDLVEYIKEQMPEDYLLRNNGLGQNVKDKENPYPTPSLCSLLSA